MNNKAKKVYEVSVTECNNFCARAYQYQNLYKLGFTQYKPIDTPHFYGARGTLVHFCLSQELKGQKFKFRYEDFKQDKQIRDNIPEWMFQGCLDDVMDYYEKGLQIIRDYKPYFDDAIVEERLWANPISNVLLGGTPDARNSRAIVDWKTSKYSAKMFKEYAKQLMGYDLLFYLNGDYTEREKVIVFLGDLHPVVKILTKEQEEEAQAEFIKDMYNTVKKKQEIEKSEGWMPVQPQFFCIMCKHINVCRGV
ncbi:MAG: PD-(D/E)XK nuclease family protein [bacterium]